MRWWHIIGAVILVSVAPMGPVGAAQETGSDSGMPNLRRFSVHSRALASCEELLKKGRHQRALASILRIEKTLDPGLRLRADLLAGRCRLARGEADNTLERMKRYVKDRSRYNPEHRECYDLAARAHVAKGEHYPALVLYDWVARHEKGLPKVLAAEGCGKALEAMKRYDKAYQAYSFALKYLRTGVQDYDRDPKLSGRLRAALRRTARLRDIDRYGEDFMLYRDAETLRRGKRKYRDALKKYREIIERFPESVYAEASGLYEGLCLVKLANVDEAEGRLAAFWKKERNGLYRGEALLEFGRIALEHRVRGRLAKGYFDTLDGWLDEVAKQDTFVEGFSIESIKEAARKLTKPPAAEKKVDFWGNVKKEKIRPGQLVNRRTCAWYLDELREQCAAFRGFLFFVAGKKEEALECYKRILDFDPQTRRMESRGIWNDYRRLKWGAEHGYLYAYPQELRLYAARQRLAVLLGDFYYVTQEFERAAGVARRLLKGEFGTLSSPQRDYPQFLLGSALYWSKGKQEAFLAYEKVFARRQGTYTEDRAMWAAGNISAFTNDAKMIERGWEYLKALGLSGRRNDYAWRARVEYAWRMLGTAREAEGVRILSTMPQSAGVYKKLAEFYLKELEEERKLKREGE